MTYSSFYCGHQTNHTIFWMRATLHEDASPNFFWWRISGTLEVCVCVFFFWCAPWDVACKGNFDDNRNNTPFDQLTCTRAGCIFGAAQVVRIAFSQALGLSPTLDRLRNADVSLPRRRFRRVARDHVHASLRTLLQEDTLVSGFSLDMVQGQGGAVCSVGGIFLHCNVVVRIRESQIRSR